MIVDLVPRMYIRQPEYWAIEVVGRVPGVGLPTLAPYTVSLPLAGIMGTEGVEVIGATRSVRLERHGVPEAPVRPTVYELRGEKAEVLLTTDESGTPRHLAVRTAEHGGTFSGRVSRRAHGRAPGPRDGRSSRVLRKPVWPGSTLPARPHAPWGGRRPLTSPLILAGVKAGGVPDAFAGALLHATGTSVVAVAAAGPR